MGPDGNVGTGGGGAFGTENEDRTGWRPGTPGTPCAPTGVVAAFDDEAAIIDGSCSQPNDLVILTFSIETPLATLTTVTYRKGIVHHLFQSVRVVFGGAPMNAKANRSAGIGLLLKTLLTRCELYQERRVAVSLVLRFLSGRGLRYNTNKEVSEQSLSTGLVLLVLFPCCLYVKSLAP